MQTMFSMTPTKYRGRRIVGMNIVLSTLNDFLNKHQDDERVVEKMLGISNAPLVCTRNKLTVVQRFAHYFKKFGKYNGLYFVVTGKTTTDRNNVTVCFDPNVKEFDKDAVAAMQKVDGIYGSFKKKVYSLLFAIWTQKEENKENEALLKMCKVLYTFNKWNEDYITKYKELPPGKTEDHSDDFGVFETEDLPQVEVEVTKSPTVSPDAQVTKSVTESIQETKSSDTSQTGSETMSGSKSKMNIKFEVDSYQAEVIKAQMLKFLQDEFNIDISSVTIEEITKDMGGLSTDTNSTDKNKKLQLRF